MSLEAVFPFFLPSRPSRSHELSPSWGRHMQLTNSNRSFLGQQSACMLLLIIVTRIATRRGHVEWLDSQLPAPFEVPHDRTFLRVAKIVQGPERAIVTGAVTFSVLLKAPCPARIPKSSTSHGDWVNSMANRAPVTKKQARVDTCPGHQVGKWDEARDADGAPNFPFDSRLVCRGDRRAGRGPRWFSVCEPNASAGGWW